MRQRGLFSFTFWLVVAAALVVNCSTVSKKGDRPLTTLELAFQEYKIAHLSEKADRPAACDSYSRLAEIKDFPLWKLVNLKSTIFCNDGRPTLERSQYENEKWLQNIFYQAQVEEARRTRNWPNLAALYMQQAARANRTREKVDLYQAALAVAKRAKLAETSDIESKLYRIAPRLSKSETDNFSIGKDWISVRDFEKGRKYFKRALKQRLSLEEQYQVRQAYRNSFKVEQKKEDYVKEAGKLARWTLKTKKREWQLEAHILWARAAWTEGLADEGRHILLKIEKRLRKKIGLSELYFVLARMEEEVNQYESAIQYLDLALNEPELQAATKNKMLFAKAWNYRKLFRFEEAARVFSDLRTFQQVDTNEIYKTQFWLAKSLAQGGRLAEAEALQKDLIQVDSMGYYGLIAYRELSQQLPPLTSGKSKSLSDPPDPRIDKQIVKALITVEEKELLEAYLNEKIQSLKATGDLNQDILFYLKSFADAGLYLPLFAQMSGLPPAIRSQVISQYPEFLFPRKYLDLIRPIAEKEVVAPAIVLSIIRQESSFNPKTRSPADAIGLMQVIPDVAEKYSPSAGVDYRSFEDLYDPFINIPIGISLLSFLNKRYKGQIALMAAAYNAGEKALDQWIKQRLKDDTLEFIEDIPYEETRSYVKYILRNFIFYQRLATPQESLAFPRDLLDPLHEFRVSQTEN